VASVTYLGPAATVVASSMLLSVGSRTLRADVVDYGGRHLVIDGEASGVALAIAAESDLVRAARKVEEAYEASSLARAAGVALDGVVFVGPPLADDADVRCGVVHDGLGLDRGPSGGATGAICAVLDAMGAVSEGYVVTVEGPSGSRLRASVAQRLAIDGVPAIVPAITGAATITGDHVFYADPA
jgi:proline racemase